MQGMITLSLIKPNAVAHGYAGPILAKIHEAGFRISAIKSMQLTTRQVRKFYAIHEGTNYFEILVSNMTAGHLVAVILEKENAVEDYRKLIGSTDPAKAEEGTLRKLFGTSVELNAVHGSDSDANAIWEANFFFSELERF